MGEKKLVHNKLFYFILFIYKHREIQKQKTYIRTIK